jgi:hypothetical protein
MNFKKTSILIFAGVMSCLLSVPVLAEADKDPKNDLITFIQKNNSMTLSTENKAYITEEDRKLEKNLDELLSIEGVYKNSSTVQYRKVDCNIDSSIDINNSEFTLLEVWEDQEEKLLSYQLYNERYILHYHPDGTVIKTVTTFHNDDSFDMIQSYNNMYFNTDSYKVKNTHVYNVSKNIFILSLNCLFVIFLYLSFHKKG